MLPTGTVTFLFTDVEGSTERWDRDRAAMQEAMRLHDRILRNAIEAREGVVFKTIGDAFCAAFGTPESAAAAAADAQRALSSANFSAVDGIRVRMAINTGTADERDGDYFGPALNRLARLLSLGHGSQILLSGATADLVCDNPSPTISVIDLGAYALRGAKRQERVFQLVAPGLQREFPALRSQGPETANNLPAELSSFVGRTDDLMRIEEMLREYRLVTLTGPGGVGKTRVALQIASKLLDDSSDGVWLAELAALSDASLIVGQVCAAVGIPPSDVQTQSALVSFLRTRRVLVVLDNCEHLVRDVALVAASILQACPGVRLLLTSREALGIPGEQVYPIGSLPSPPPAPIPTRDTVTQFGAITLLVDRARAADRRFMVTDENAPVLADIVRRLDGIPLAIELAAARLKTMAAVDLSKRLDHKLSLLTGGSRIAAPRHHTIRATIEWSYDLLSAREQLLLRRLAVFAGAFSLDALVQSFREEGIDELEVIDLLASLVEKSLVQIDPDLAGRYRLLESTSEYASDKLKEAGEFDAAARAHAATYVTLAEELDALWSSNPGGTWYARARLEVDNWRVALEWALGRELDAQLGQRLVVALRFVPWLTLAEKRHWLACAERAVTPQTPRWLVGRLHLCEAQIYARGYQWDAVLPAAKQALTDLRAAGDSLYAAFAERYVGYALVRLGDVAQGELSLRSAFEAFRELSAHHAMVWVLGAIADTKSEIGEIAAARSIYAEALETFNATGAAESATVIRRNLAEIEFRTGNVDSALRLANEALAYDRATNNRIETANDLANIAAYLLRDDRIDEAKDAALEAISLMAGTNVEAYVVVGLQHLAGVSAIRAGKDRQRRVAYLERAGLLLGYVDSRISSLKITRQFTEQEEYDRILCVIGQGLGSNSVATLARRGATLTEQQAVAEGSQA